MGVVLSQVQDGKERVVAYWSQQLDKFQWSFSIIEREALAVVSAVKEFYPYLYGFHFRIVTDHNPLTNLTGLQDVGDWLTRWILFLQQFDFAIEYKPGQQNSNAGVLSRVPAIKEQVIAAVTTGNYLGDKDQIHQAQASDALISAVVSAIQQNTPLPFPFERQKNSSWCCSQDHILSVLHPSRGASHPTSCCPQGCSKRSASTTPWQCWSSGNKEGKGKSSRASVLAWLWDTWRCESKNAGSAKEETPLTLQLLHTLVRLQPVNFWEAVLGHYGSHPYIFKRGKMHPCHHWCVHKMGGSICHLFHRCRNLGMLVGERGNLSLWSTHSTS